MREIHIVAVRVLEALDLIPEMVHLVKAVAANILQAGRLINALPLFKNRQQQRDAVDILQRFLLPGGNGVKNKLLAFGTNYFKHQICHQVCLEYVQNFENVTSVVNKSQVLKESCH